MFAGLMDTASVPPIRREYHDYCMDNWKINLALTPSSEQLQARHLRLVASALTQFEEWHSNQPVTHYLGYSVGQYAALAAAGAIEWQTAFNTVKTFVDALEVASKLNPSTLITILGVPIEKIESLISEEFSGSAFLSSYNAKMNICVGVMNHQVEKVISRLETLRPIKTIQFKEHAAWHTMLMNPALELVQPVYEKLAFKNVPVSLLETTKGEILDLRTLRQPELVENLLRSLVTPVAFALMMETLLQNKAKVGVEFGLSPFLSKVTPFISREFKIQYLGPTGL